MKTNTRFTRGRLTAMLAGFCDIIENDDFEFIESPPIVDKYGITWTKVKIQLIRKSKKWTILTLRISDETFPSIHIDSGTSPDLLPSTKNDKPDLVSENKPISKATLKKLSKNTLKDVSKDEPIQNDAFIKIHTGKRGRPKRLEVISGETSDDGIWDLSEVIDEEGNWID